MVVVIVIERMLAGNTLPAKTKSPNPAFVTRGNIPPILFYLHSLLSISCALECLGGG